MGDTMRFPPLLGVAFVIGASACADRPTDPSSFVRLEVDLRSQIAPGESRPLVARAIRVDGLTRQVTTQATWTQKTGAETVSLTLTATGPTATGIRPGSFLVSASLGGLTAEGEILVLSPGTFRLIGQVSYQGAPIPDATLSVVAGAGEGLTGRSDTAGKYASTASPAGCTFAPARLVLRQNRTDRRRSAQLPRVRDDAVRANRKLLGCLHACHYRRPLHARFP